MKKGSVAVQIVSTDIILVFLVGFHLTLDSMQMPSSFLALHRERKKPK